MYGFLFYWSIRVKLVKEVDVCWKVYVDEEIGIYDIYREGICGLGRLVLITPALIIRNPMPPSYNSNKQNFEQLSLLIHKQNKFWLVTLTKLVMLYYADMVVIN